jgi:hypothetical protein
MTTSKLFTVLFLLPGAVAAQEDPTARLREVLPSSVAEEVIATVQEAVSRGLPGYAVANAALEGVAKGRSGEDIAGAARRLLSELAAAHDALRRGQREPTATEVEAGATALRLGVDGSTVSALASSAPSGRSLAVPLFVTGALVDRGVPADAALAAVLARLEARAGDAELVQMPAEAGRMLFEGMTPAESAAALGSQRAGFTLPVGGISLPVAGPPPGVPINPGGDIPGKRPIPPVVPPRPQRPPE